MIYKFSIITDKDKIGHIKEITETFQVEEEKFKGDFLEKFKWNKINIWNVPDRNEIICIWTDINGLTNFKNGLIEGFMISNMCNKAKNQELIYDFQVTYNN